MAQPAQTPFAVDSDITPLQGRFFNSVTANISDPNLRSQLYDKVRSTFGGIQQARDIQRARSQEDEERSVALELRRAQLDQSKLELGLARDKVRQQQNAASKTQEFNSAFDDFVNYELDGLGPEEAKKKLNLFGAQYADVLVYNPAAKAKIDLANSSLETARTSSTSSASFWKGLAAMPDDEAVEAAAPGATSDPRYIAARTLADQRRAEQSAKQDLVSKVASSNVAEKIADKANKNVTKLIDEGTSPNWSLLDTSLRELDKLGFIKPDQKIKLLEYGINVFKTKDDETEVKKGKTSAQGLDALQEIFSEAYIEALGSKSQNSLALGATAEPDPLDELGLDD